MGPLPRDYGRLFPGAVWLQATGSHESVLDPLPLDRDSSEQRARMAGEAEFNEEGFCVWIFGGMRF